MNLRLGVVAAAAALALASFSASAASPPEREPIEPLRAPAGIDPNKAWLGERLFQDRRLSGDGQRSCSSCHHVEDNGASHNIRDLGPDGRPLPVNTPTVFNAALSFRLTWTGAFRTLESQAEASLRSPAAMAANPEAVITRLNRDPQLSRDFRLAYGRAADLPSLLDALATYERTLVTPGSRFDAWLDGDAAALNWQEARGYRLFKSVGCAACHQGVNVGGNLFERHGIFHPLASAEPARLRVPSLRNVSRTAPYFHDGSAPTLQRAVRAMGRGQLNRALDDGQVADIVAFLRTLDAPLPRRSGPAR